jgi:hypothetical protein
MNAFDNGVSALTLAFLRDWQAETQAGQALGMLLSLSLDVPPPSVQRVRSEYEAAYFQHFGRKWTN